jgi:hypothetical protein
MANPSKFFSAALEAAQNLKQKRGTAQQMRSMLLQGGAKPKELEYTGVDQWFKHNEGKKQRLGPTVDDSITQDALVRYLDENQVKPEEVLKRGRSRDDQEQQLLHDVTEAVMQGNEEVYRNITGHGFDSDMHDMVRESRALQRQIRESGGDQNLMGEYDSLRDRVMSQMDVGFDGSYDLGNEPPGTKWSQYVTGEPSDKYTEHLVTLPNSPNAVGKMTPGPNPHYQDADYQSPHWEEPNVLAHMRYDYDPDALRLEEIQSDWLQQGREKGFRFEGEDLKKWYKMMDDARDMDRGRADAMARAKQLAERYGPEDPDAKAAFDAAYRMPNSFYWEEYQKAAKQNAANIPRAPLANVNDWTSMMVRRAMLEAAEQDLPKLRWTTGLMQDRRYSPQAGRAKYYDEIIPNIVKKIAKPYGDAVVTPQYWDGGMGGSHKWDRETDAHTHIGDQEFWQAELPPKLIEALQKKGKVPFFKYGGEVE